MQKSHWQATASIPSFPQLERNLHVDVVVIGAGITGVTAAYLLKRAGKTVALLERDTPGQADTGHTTAHLTCVTDARLDALVRQFGRDHARAVWEAGMAAIHQIQANVEAEDLSCGFRRVPGYLHAALTPKPADERDHFKLEAQLARELGFDADFVESVPVVAKPGMRVAHQALFHPLQYLAGLLKAIPGDGSHVFAHAEVSEVTEAPLTVKVGEHEVTCGDVVIATHVPLMGKSGMLSATLFQSKLAPYSTYAIGAKIEKGIVPEASYWDTSEPYYYLRIDPHRDHDYAIFGGEDHKTGQVTNTDERFERLEGMLRQLVPSARPDARWSGQVIETNDGLPLIGEINDHQYIATGFAGNGMTFGTLGGIMATDGILGRRNPWKQLFDPHRKKLIGGTWDYLKENFDYPWYLLKDRLTAGAREPLESVQPGEGKLLTVNGQRVAAYRSDKGKLTCLSPTCTHMGCLVHWNTAERTWDCPCHGSRFRPTGEVLGGPAETPLAPVDPEK